MIASARISRPSASVFRISIVLPESDVTISPGRCALLPGIFSTAGTMPVTAIAGFSCAMACMAPITAAPPAMSYFIFSMPSEGLMEMPPVSKVTPLPMSAEMRLAGGVCRLVLHDDHAPEARRCPAPRPAARPCRAAACGPDRALRRTGPLSSAIARARSAIASGVSRFGGSTAISRERLSASPMMRPAFERFVECGRRDAGTRSRRSRSRLRCPSLVGLKMVGFPAPAEAPSRRPRRFAASTVLPSSANATVLDAFAFQEANRGGGELAQRRGIELLGLARARPPGRGAP